MSQAARILEAARAMGVPLEQAAAERMAAHLALVAKWNKVHNLTAVRDTEQMVVLHVSDSLSVLPSLAGAATVLDVGTGAGFPGIPLAIAIPGMRVSLLDASHKKCSFLEQAKAELGLANVDVVCERVERWETERRYDAVISRAFADLGDFVSQAGHLVSRGGVMFAMKGVHPYEEIGRIPKSHRVREVKELLVPELDAKRHLVSVEAVG